MSKKFKTSIINRLLLKIVTKKIRECKELKEQIENKDKWCELIADIGYDYDGYNDVKNLKELIDELVSYSLNAKDNCDYEKFIFKGEE